MQTCSSDSTDPATADKAVAVALAEFNALRAEVVSHITAQAALVGLGLTALGVVAGLVIEEGGDQRLLLAIPPLATLVVLLHAAGTYRLALIGHYISTTLWPYLDKQVRGEPLPSWEKKREERLLKTPSILAKAILLDFPAMILFIAASPVALLHVDERESPWWWLGWLLMLIAIAVPIGVALSAWKNARSRNSRPAPLV
jgi:hypothetical protein